MRINKKLTRQERKQQKLDQLAFNTKGKGKYVFANNTSGDLKLLKPNAAGKLYIGKDEQFEGDDYFFQMVKTHDLRYIREIAHEESMKENKLILDQPDAVTTEGKVEYVETGKGKKQLNENRPEKKEKNVLLTEDPISGVVIVE